MFFALVCFVFFGGGDFLGVFFRKRPFRFLHFVLLQENILGLLQ